MRSVAWNGETLGLLPERVVWWAREKALLLADPHFGKTATFRAAGVPIPGGVTADDLARLTDVVHRTGASRVVFLGDFFHAKSGRAPALLHALHAWREAHASLDLTLVRGNHDRHAGDPPAHLRIECAAEPLLLGGFALRHHPIDGPAARPTLAGHLHPVAVLTDGTGLRHRLPCFWLAADQLVLPAFGTFTGGAAIPARAGDRVFVVADEVIEVGVVERASP